MLIKHLLFICNFVRYYEFIWSKQDDDACFNDPSNGSPYGDFGWWTQNNGYHCSNDSKETESSHYREYCYEKIKENNTEIMQLLNNTNICNWPRGTDGQQFHPYIEKEERLWIFQTDICRSLYMDFQVSLICGFEWFHRRNIS